MLENDVFLRALRREPTPYTPVWLMRQAGRYLPEYNATRAKAGSFLALAKTPSLATEVTLQPLDRFPLDAAILFSDILTIPDAMGLGLHFADGEGPRFERTVCRRECDRSARSAGHGALRYVFDAMREIKRALNGRVPLIGFAGSPFTLACYMIEGAGSPDFASVRRMAHGRPDLLQRLVAVNASAVAAYLNEQILAGADAVMIFDTWGGLLTTARLPFALARFDASGAGGAAPGDRMGDGSRDRVHQGRRAMARRPRDVRRAMRRARLDRRSRRCAPTRGRDRVALQGNLDPMVLLADAYAVAREATAVVRAAGAAPGHIFNLGHGIVPSTPPENVAVWSTPCTVNRAQLRAGT